MKKGLFITSAMVLLLVFLVQYAASGNQKAEAVSQEQIRQNMHRTQIPFIANNGQMDERVTFYANTFGGTVFVTKDGEIVYALPNNNSDVETQGIASLKHSPDAIHDTRKINDLHPPTPNSQPPTPNMSLQGVALKETLIGAKVKEIKGEDKSATKINYFKGNDQKKWKSNISTYDVVNLGEVYNGIELKLKAYGNNVEKLFHVKPGADPDQIKINLSGIQPPDSKEKGEAAFPFIDRQPPESPFPKGDLVISPSTIGSADASQHSTTKPLTLKESITKSPLKKGGRGVVSPDESRASGLWINEQGQLVAETELGPVTFTKPVAYQEIDGKRVNVAVEYEIYAVPQVVYRNKPVLTSGRNAKNAKESIVVNTENAGNVCPPLAGVKGVERDSSHVIQPTTNPKSKRVNLSSTEIGDPKLEYGFKVASYDKTKELVIDPLLASTYLGGSYIDYGKAIVFDSNSNIYVTGFTSSSNFPTTNGVYDTSNSTYDVFISKLDNLLTSLQASTYLGGSSHDEAFALTLDGNNNIYVTGYTSSSDYPTTDGGYNTSFNGTDDVFISKLDSSLTSLQASTYLGGTSVDFAYGIALDSSNNIYVTGHTGSSDFPTTNRAYDTSFNDAIDVFLSKFDSTLSSLQGSTYLGGSSDDYGNALLIDSNNNIYVTGYTSSSNFPVTNGTYDTSFNGTDDVFISKLDSSLTSLQASTYLGGSSGDYGYAIAIDVSSNVYVTGYTESGDYPTTSGAYATSSNGSNDLLISKLNSSLTSLHASTYLGGSSKDYGYAITTDMSDNVYVTGYTTSSDFPTTSDVYDSGRNGSYDIFISKLDNSLSVSAPTVSTNSVTNITINSATLNGTVNANDRSTTVWFEYGLYSGLYDYSTSTKTISGSTDQAVSIDIYNLYAGTKYYYRIVAENEIGTAYGDEMSFTTLSDTTKPSGSISINNGNSYTNSANVTLKLSASDDVGITGYYISTSSYVPSSSSSGWTSISSTTNYSANISYTLDGGDGSKTIYAWYMDDAGNISDTYNDFIILDTTPPEINITSPTTNDTYSTTISVVSLWGNASDATSGISTVKWENNKGGSGTASGTTSWSISNIGLLVDAENIITVTATDNAGNSASDSITVTYSELTAEPTTISTVTATPTPKATPIELGAILGSVVDTDGKPVANATVFTDKGGYSAKTGSNGIYQLNDVAEGSYLLTALAEGYGSVSQRVTVKAGETTQADFTLLRAITPPTPVPSLSPSVNPIPSTTPTPSTLSGKIFGYVMDEIDNPVKKVKVRCKGKNTNVKENATTNKQGYFEFNNLSADSYKITAKKKGFDKSKYNVNLEEGEEKEIEIVLEEK